MTVIGSMPPLKVKARLSLSTLRLIAELHSVLVGVEIKAKRVPLPLQLMIRPAARPCQCLQLATVRTFPQRQRMLRYRLSLGTTFVQGPCQARLHDNNRPARPGA